jgi:aminopeptidase-like protein
LALKDRCYRVYINSELKPGVLNYGELIIPGNEDSEIFISTYVCHPSMANNELSGPVVATALALWIMGLDKKRFTYRFIFIPETIGSIVYLSRHLDELKKNVIAGFNLTCVGDNRTYSFMPTPWGNTLVDRVSELVLGLSGVEYTKYSVLDRGSDERQYCWPGIEIPVVSIMRSKYGTYPEYHTSMDNLDLVTPDGLGGALSLHQQCIQIIESNYIYRANCLCEPCMGKRGLYPMLSTLDQKKTSRALIDLVSRLRISSICSATTVDSS